MTLASTATAEVAALSRALATCDPRLPQPCDDELANVVLHPFGRLLLSRAILRVETRRLLERAVPGIYAWHSLRTRYFDVALQRALAAGVSQVVILGAGLDTRASRLCAPAGRAAVFEVDQSPLGPRKAKALSRSLGSGAVPQRLLRVDLTGDGPGLRALLAEHGFDATERSFVLCEGLLMYLPPGTVRKLLREVSGLAAKVTLAFDFVHQALLDTQGTSDGSQILRSASLARVPYLSGFDPQTLAATLEAVGFRLEEQLDGLELAQRVWGTAPSPYAIPRDSSVAVAHGPEGSTA